MHLIPFSPHKEREREKETSLCEMKMLKKKRSKLLEQDQAGSDKDDDQDQLQREAYQAKWLNYKHIGLVSSPNSSSKQDYHDLGRRVMRSTGRKDRHSKICTAKGPRDRRVRLAANTAIQFYDLQDRLGYDRPSEAIEWLMKEAKLAIDDLQALPHETEQKTEHQTEFKFSNDKEDPFMGFLVQSDLHYLLHSTSSAKPRSQNQTFGYNHPVQPSLLSGSTSLNSEATFSNWSLPQTLELRNVESFFDVSGSAPQWVQAVPGGTLQSSYSRAMFGNLEYGNIPTLGPCLGTNNFSANDPFSGFHNLPESQGEDEKQNPYPNKPSSGSFLLNFQD